MRQNEKSTAPASAERTGSGSSRQSAADTGLGYTTVSIILIIAFLLGVIIGNGCPQRSGGASPRDSRSYDDDRYYDYPRWRVGAGDF